MQAQGRPQEVKFKKQQLETENERGTTWGHILKF